VSLTTYAACDSTAISAADSACATTSELHVSLNHLTIWTTLTFAHQGGKNRRRGKNENDNEKRELTFKEEGQEYAQVLKMRSASTGRSASPTSVASSARKSG
jgi:hypothetical protein